MEQFNSFVNKTTDEMLGVKGLEQENLNDMFSSYSPRQPTPTQIDAGRINYEYGSLYPDNTVGKTLNEFYEELGRKVEDVKINGVTVVTGGVANIPLASPTVPGVVVAGTITVTGTTPSITALPGVRYVCGEVSTIDITVPATGIVDIVFTSGSTPAVLTVTPPTGMTMRWANGFDPTTLDANTVYEINIMDGCYGVVGTWT